MKSRKDSWLERRQRLPLSDVSESFISVIDIKHYIYCPRIIYFDHVLHATPIFGYQQEEGKEQHEDYVRKELRRRDAICYSPEFVGAEKLLFTTLSSSGLGLRGNVDCIIKTANGECIPVDYKNMASDGGKAWMDHKYQLVAYALLIEESFNTIVKRGFINYIPETLVLGLEITPSMKVHVKRVLGHIKRIVEDGELPPVRVAKNKCTGGCGHKQTCQ